MTGDMQRRNIGQSEPAENPSEGEGSPKKTPRGTGERSTRPRRLTLEEGRVGQVLNGRYRLLELIGKGGMAAVYKAEHLGMPLPVAVKMLLPDIEEDELMVERFVREAKTSGRATHPHVVQLMDYGQAEDNSRYIVVEYLDGQSLAQLLKKEEQLSVERVVHIASQICEALDDSHRKNIIHRDLKPSNIMLIQQDDKDDFVKVVDFGLAKINGGDSQRLTQTGELFGSPIYMSPEQCRGLPLDGRSDIYSLGIMMYEALAGKAPLVGDNIVATITKHLHESPQSFKTVRADLYVPARLEAVILKALAKDPCDRFATMGEFREALKVAVPGPLDAVGLRKLNSYMLPGMLNSLSERTSLLIALSMVVMIIVVCATAAVTTFLKSRHHSTAVQVRSNHSAMEKPVDVSPPRGGHHGATAGKDNPPPINSSHLSSGTPIDEQTAVPSVPSTQPVAHKPEANRAITKPPTRKKPAVPPRGTVNGGTLRKQQPGVDTVNSSSQEYHRPRNRNEMSNEELFYEFQRTEMRGSGPRTWNPAISGTNQGK